MSDHRKLTQEELLTEATARFGADPLAWAFRCPSCGDVATGQDFSDALADNPRLRGGRQVIASDLLGQECIGRTLGALSKKTTAPKNDRGCDWAAYGLFSGPWEIVLPDGRSMWAFPLADAPKDEARASIPRALTDEDEAVTVEAMARFGDDLRAWAFVCPSCGDIADGRDFSEALAATPRMNDGRLLDASDLLGKECIGRTLGALKTAEDKPKRGCGHAAYGLLASTPDGCPRWVFPLADTPKERA